MRSVLRPDRGFTLIELVVTLTLVSVLALVVVPAYDVTVRHARESELRTSLRTIRDALDAYKAAVDAGYISKGTAMSGYPPDLRTLVVGVDTIQQPVGAPSNGAPPGVNLPPAGIPGVNMPGAANLAPGAAPGAGTAGTGQAAQPTTPSVPPHMVFLRQVPRDPFYPDQTVAPEQQWNIRSYGSQPDDFTEGDDVYDVVSKSKELGLNGIAYSEW
jgi:general secretion pathway protein G